AVVVCPQVALKPQAVSRVCSYIRRQPIEQFVCGAEFFSHTDLQHQPVIALCRSSREPLLQLFEIALGYPKPDKRLRALDVMGTKSLIVKAQAGQIITYVSDHVFQ